MRLGIIFVITLAVSVIVSSVAVWGLTYSTSYNGLRDMASGFVGLATVAVNDFAKLVWRLISDSATLVFDILDTEHERSLTQLNETGQQFLQTTADLMARARNTTAQAQGLVGTLVVSFGGFMQLVISDFKVVGTDYASRLRTESASRVQAIFSSMLQDRIYAIQRQARQYELGLLSFGRLADEPLDDGSCVLLGSLCSASDELQNNMYIGTAAGNMMYCDVKDVSYALMIRRGSTADQYSFLSWPPYTAANPDAPFAVWKRSCLAGSNASFLNQTCRHGEAVQSPACNGSCGYDPRCRPWYSIHASPGPPQTQMSDVYVDIQKNVPVVSLSYPIYSGVPRALIAVAATDFYFRDVDAFLRTLSPSQRVAVVLDSPALIVVGTSHPCADPAEQASGVAIAQVCDPALRGLGRWLEANRSLGGNASVELDGTLWDVFPSTVDSFNYFVAVGMNKTEVYAVINTTETASRETLQTMSQQQSDRMAALEGAVLAEMDAVAQRKMAKIHALQAEESRHMLELQNQTALAFNGSQLESAANLSRLLRNEMAAIDGLEDRHLSHVVQTIGVTFGAAVGIFIVILLLGAYGTYVVTKQVQRITEAMEDVAHMRVEQLEVSQKSAVREVQRIEAALGVLVLQLAEYKSYMPTGLFQLEEKPPTPPELATVPSPRGPAVMRRGLQFLRPHPPANPLAMEPVFSELPLPAAGDEVLSCLPGEVVCAVPVTGGTRLSRRSVAVMAVNVVDFNMEMAQRPPGELEGMLNRLIATVHGMACQAMGNIDAVVGDQLLVTFNAHFRCSDPCTAASNVALDLVAALRQEAPVRVHAQVGLSTGQVYAGHLGCSPFKAMVALGPPMKVAALLSHLSGFKEPVVLACPSIEERVKYHFTLQPADLVALPVLGTYVPLYSKSISVFTLEGRASARQEGQEWLYQVSAGDSPGSWTAMFGEVTRSASADKVKAHLAQYLVQHPENRLAQRLFSRLPLWQPRTGIVLAERPDVPRDANRSNSSAFPLSLSL